MTATGAPPHALVGVIADDVTGGTDVAIAFRRRGLTVSLHFVVPDEPPPGDVDIIVIALKTRTVAADEAVASTTTAARWLLAHGTQRLYFKYCSTFDSTPDGNIGPVLDALMATVGAARVVHTPSSPEHGRTQYLGHLFVNDQLLSDSPMRNHPLTPMRDSRLIRVLQPQTTSPVHLISHRSVAAGPDALRRELAATPQGNILIDAVDDDELRIIGNVLADEQLLAGAAGLAGGLAEALISGRAANRPPTSPAERSATVMLAGSCSARTLEQIAEFERAGGPSHQLRLERDQTAEAMAHRALAWAEGLPSATTPLIYSSLPAAELHAIQERYGVAESAAMFERAMRLIARELLRRGARRFVVAGGETSGAVIDALGVEWGAVGDEAAPGVPWLTTPDGVALLLKSGNFGDVELLARVAETWGERA